MGWEIDQEKTVEVRKNFPKDPNWNRKSIIYCSKNKQSFNRIPKKYQPLMERFLGRVIGEFLCDRITEYECSSDGHGELATTCVTCLTYDEIINYCNGNELYGWHITDLVIYDKQKELGEFKAYNRDCKYSHLGYAIPECKYCHGCQVTRPPMSWMFIEELGV